MYRPALMNELHKLRTDNSDLLKKIDASSIDSLNFMESQIADQKCINTSLQVYIIISYSTIDRGISCVNTEIIFIFLHLQTHQLST